MKLIYMSFVGLLTLTSFYILTPINSNKILWSPTVKLDWKDFQGPPDSLSSYAALTYLDISQEQLSKSTSQLTVSVKCSFDRSLSWSKDKESDALLKHEQFHFNIGELITRKIRKAYKEHISYDLKQTNETFNRIFDSLAYYTLDRLNAQYDHETIHGTVEPRQKEWELRIAKALKELDAYASTRVVIRRK